MSGVKVTNERPARPIPDSDSVIGVGDGTGNVDWDPDTTTGIPPGNDEGDVLTWDGDSWEPVAPTVSYDGMVPYYIPDGETFTVPLYKQALFSETISGPGLLVVSGMLIEVD